MTDHRRINSFGWQFVSVSLSFTSSTSNFLDHILNRHSESADNPPTIAAALFAIVDLARDLYSAAATTGLIEFPTPLASPLYKAWAKVRAENIFPYELFF